MTKGGNGSQGETCPSIFHGGEFGQHFVSLR